jgi:hypothetical protein
MNGKISKKEGKSSDYANSNIKKDPDYQTFKLLYEKLKSKYNFQVHELATTLEKKEILLPSCIFNEKISAFESIVNFLKENQGIPNKEIAIVLGKSQKSVWQCYNNCKQKHPSQFKIVASEYYIPVSALKTELTILEAIVSYLKDFLNLKFHEIGLALKRDDRTVWTVYDRANKRRDGKK